ncbi:MAG: hypothetical protein IJV04_03760 [Lachnospiraceae bacterium]|nr:hypothetical protein [Lachnospiraceae bacterium]
MKSERVVISNIGENFERALDEVERYAEENGITGRAAFHLRLLAEETIGLVKSMTGKYTAYFWLENAKNHLHTINLEGTVELTGTEKERLLSMSKSGGNILARGIMGKIRDLIETGALTYKESGQNSILDYGVVMPTDPDMMMSPGMVLGMTEQFWSLQSYRQNVIEANREREYPEELQEMVDELEHSIVANLAEDIQIGILDGKMKMIISYRAVS